MDQNTMRARIRAEGQYVASGSHRPACTSSDSWVLPRTYVKQVYAVTPQRVTEVAKKYLRGDQATIVVVGDRKAIAEQLKPYGDNHR